MSIYELDSKLYISKYGLPKVGNYSEIWSSIKNDKEVLNKAIKVVRNKWNDGDTINGIAIAEAILLDYDSVDKDIYNKLIDLIYSNKDIARIVIGKRFSSDKVSFLLMSLLNHDLRLTKRQKDFAVNEVNDSSHTFGIFDIRYHILNNPNWSLEEKQKLVMDFYDDETYDEYLDAWEYSIVNDSSNYRDNIYPLFDRFELFNEYTYEMLLKFYKDKKVTDEIWKEIQFCKQMHKLRPQKWEKRFHNNILQYIPES